jgi:hypothetical protein
MSKLIKNYTFSDDRQIWRILISETNKLVIETRDTAEKEVYFHILETDSGKAIKKEMQLEEKFWVGIEKVYNDLIIFHKFAKPDMPGHRGLLVYDINSDKILWESDSHSFLTLHNNKIYCYTEKFEGRNFYSLDANTGEMLKDLGEDFKKVNEIRDAADSEFPAEKYLFPKVVFNPNSAEHPAEINKLISGIDIVGNVEYNIYGNILLMTYHTEAGSRLLNNNFIAFDLQKGEKLFSEIINRESSTMIPDAFFVYEDLLFLISGKDKLTIYNLVE